MKIQIKFFIQL